MPPFGGVWQGHGTAGPGLDRAKTAGRPARLIAQIGEAATQACPRASTSTPSSRKLLAGPPRDEPAARSASTGAAARCSRSASLLLEGTPIRFVGQDVQRGTFSHRHAFLHDYNTGRKYFPLRQSDSRDQAPIIIVNTMLSELAVLGFEYGFASADPRNLVIWEAQFGDFVNGAQPIIDQFIVAGESKWRKHCGLVMLLPHGYEGQGPEHSNAYVERFLQLCAENNMQVCMPTMPAQYFHLLRRQILRKFRKPLICSRPRACCAPSRPVRCISRVHRPHVPARARRSGERPARGRPPRAALHRQGLLHARCRPAQEQRATTWRSSASSSSTRSRRRSLQPIIAKYSNAQEIAWVQEEPKNRGGWSFMEQRLRPILPDVAVLNYFGRTEAASPAVGSYHDHVRQEQLIVGNALELQNIKPASERPPSRKRPATRPRLRLIGSCRHRRTTSLRTEFAPMQGRLCGLQGK